MITTKTPIPARRTQVGQYGIHYPDMDQAGFVLPAGATLEPLSWAGGGHLKAYTLLSSDGNTVVWIKDLSGECK
jgi:hypothetical protein